MWFRDSPHEKTGVTEEELREIGVARESEHHGIPWGTALRLSSMWRMAAICGCFSYSHGFFQAWLPLYLVRGRGFTEAALVFSSFTYVVEAAANGLGGAAGDWLAKRHGLRTARRSIGVVGQGLAALFCTAAILSPSRSWALVFISLGYGSYLFQQPNFCALCLDVGRKNAGAVFGVMNTAANAAAALCAVVFGTMVGRFGN